MVFGYRKIWFERQLQVIIICIWIRYLYICVYIEAAGHGNPIEGYEILHTNIEAALSNLHLTYSSWDWEHEAHPQGERYLTWLKSQLANNFGVVQFILCKGDGHNAYGTEDDPNIYDHIEPFYKLYTNHSLDDTTVYDTDVVNHASDYAPDGSQNLGYFRNFSSLLDDTSMEGNCLYAQPGWGYNEMYPCIYTDITYGYAITGLDDANGESALPLTLYVNSTFEPDVRRGEEPVPFQGQLAIEGLSAGEQYVIYRWDSYQDFPPSGNYESSKYSFKYLFNSTGESYEMFDANLFLSDGSVVYRCVHF